MAVTLNGQTVPLPRDFAPTLMKNAFESSVVSPLSPSEPLSIGTDTVIPQYDGGIEAGFVDEGQAKPVSDAAMSFKTLSARKLAAIVVVSKEAAQVNPTRMLELIQADMQNAITRAIDLGILYGKDAKSGAQLSGVEYVDKTTNRVKLGAGDLVPQILAGYDAAGTKSDPTGFMFDTTMRTKISLATQQDGVIGATGTPQRMPNLASSNISSVAGLPASYGRVVSGRVGANPQTKVRGYVGDWSKLRWGFAENITMTSSDQATIVDGATTYHLFQQNLKAFLVEAHVGWTITDTNAFAAYEVE